MSAQYKGMKEAQPKVMELAQRKLELTRQIREMTLEVAKLNEALLREGSEEAISAIAGW